MRRKDVLIFYIFDGQVSLEVMAKRKATVKDKTKCHKNVFVCLVTCREIMQIKNICGA